MGNKQRLKTLRNNFRINCEIRDNHTCKICNTKSSTYAPVEIHHIKPRSQMPNHGYAISNGITLCPHCHLLAEQYLNNKNYNYNYSPENLYKLINSSLEKAIKDSNNL